MFRDWENHLPNLRRNRKIVLGVPRPGCPAMVPGGDMANRPEQGWEIAFRGAVSNRQIDGRSIRRRLAPR